MFTKFKKYFYTYKSKCNKCGTIEEVTYSTRKPKENQIEFCYPCGMKTVHIVSDIEEHERERV